MIIISEDRCTGYSQPGHPERPERVAATVKKLRSQKELALSWSAPEAVSDDQLLRAHSAEHLAGLQGERDFDADTPDFRDIGAYARASAGAALAACKAARQGKSAFSLMRPPGHHA